MGTHFSAPIAEQIWDAKYRFKQFDGTPIDEDVEDSWRRIAKHLASAEKDPELWEPKFYEALEDFKFLPAGRITAGAGTDRSVTLFNCFVMGTIPDSMDGIFSMLKEAALTMQQGGGIGYDFSTIRPSGAEVKGVAADASGPLTFMDVWDAMCRTVMSAGSRRGAMMATMRCDHPDILKFIEAKRDPKRLRMFNMSVLVTDDFMAAVKADGLWELHFQKKIYKTMAARELWNQIMQATYDVAEPGVIFIDRINKMNNLGYCETIAATNPCGEQPLPPYGACLLGSINLARLIDDPFELDSGIDRKKLSKLVRTAVRMMDNVIEVSNFPLQQQRQEAVDKRRIGLGVTGLADALIMCGLIYGSDEACRQTEEWLRYIAIEAYLASADLAAEKGSFPLLDREKFLASGNMQQMSKIVHDAVRTFGIRNALLTSIAPTGTISLYAGNVSSGIEPVFAHEYTRKVLQKDGSKVEEVVQDFAVKAYWDWFGEGGSQHPGDLPATFVTAQDLPPEAHIRMQAAAQKWIDSSISKTINLPADISFDDFQQVYMDAYDSGCKGCTTYRPNDVTGSVLSVAPKPEAKGAPEPVKEVQAVEQPAERPEHLNGTTYKLKWPNDPHAIYVTVNDKDGRPFEVFFNTKNTGHQAWMMALSRTISAVFRRGGDSRFIAQELMEVFDPKGGAWVNGTYVPSLIAAIGQLLSRHMDGGLCGAVRAGEITLNDALGVGGSSISAAACTSCGALALVMSGGCSTCSSCGYSKCG